MSGHISSLDGAAAFEKAWEAPRQAAISRAQGCPVNEGRIVAAAVETLLGGLSAEEDGKLTGASSNHHLTPSLLPNTCEKVVGRPASAIAVASNSSSLAMACIMEEMVTPIVVCLASWCTKPGRYNTGSNALARRKDRETGRPLGFGNESSSYLRGQVCWWRAGSPC